MDREDKKLLKCLEDAFEAFDSDTLYVFYSVIDQILVDWQYFEDDEVK